ncbi:MAG: hypothetical protein PHN64_03520 [Desulfovibrionaceae bacterium]|nr:hypothetical protein [Desulfovibrionaceae bacterium]
MTWIEHATTEGVPFQDVADGIFRLAIKNEHDAVFFGILFVYIAFMLFLTVFSAPRSAFKRPMRALVLRMLALLFERLYHLPTH